MNNIAIIGAGPAGVSAAVQLRRYGFNVDIFESNIVGGLARNANLIENLPPFHKGISGKHYARLLKNNLLAYIDNPIYEEVESIEYRDNQFAIFTDSEIRKYDIVIIASGTKPNSPSISLPESERIFYEVAELIKKINGSYMSFLRMQESKSSLSFLRMQESIIVNKTDNIKNKDEIVNNQQIETFSDSCIRRNDKMEKQKNIIIIGAGDAAFDYALNLANQGGNNIKILNRNDKLKCLPLLFNRVKANPHIEYIENCELQAVESLANELIINTNIEKFNCDYLLFAIGRSDNRSFIGDSVKNNEIMLLNDKRLHYIGDICNGLYRQISIATGDGVRAAMEIYERWGRVE